MTEKYTPHANDYIRVQGNKQYLPVPARVQWFRGEHPDWGITTTVYALDWDAGYVIMRAAVVDSAGRLIAQGTKTETRKGFGDFVEKAETGAVGRALARAGYGTEDALDLEGDRYADAPIEQPQDGERSPGRRRSGDSSATTRPAAQRTPEEQSLIGQLLELPGMTVARMQLLADAVGIPKGATATADQLREMLRIAQTPLEQPGQPAVGMTAGSSPAPVETPAPAAGQGEAASSVAASPTDTPQSVVGTPSAATPPEESASPPSPPAAAPTDEEILAAAGPGAEMVPPELQERIAKARSKGKKAEPVQETLAEALGNPVSDG